MKKDCIKTIIFSIIIASLISLFIWIITSILLSNLGKVGKLIYDNQYFISYMERLSQKDKEYPFAILFCLTLVNAICLNFLKKHKVIFIILIVIISILSLVTFILITKLGDLFVFQHLEELKNQIIRYSQFS